MSCSGAEPGFSVRVDFLSDTGSNGAVGVFKDGRRWISSEDGSFSSDADSTSSQAGVMLFADNDVTVRMNASLSQTEIEVGGSINVMVIHNYGGELCLIKTQGVSSFQATEWEMYSSYSNNHVCILHGWSHC